MKRRNNKKSIFSEMSLTQLLFLIIGFSILIPGLINNLFNSSSTLFENIGNNMFSNLFGFIFDFFLLCFILFFIFIFISHYLNIRGHIKKLPKLKISFIVSISVTFLLLFLGLHFFESTYDVYPIELIQNNPYYMKLPIMCSSNSFKTFVPNDRITCTFKINYEGKTERLKTLELQDNYNLSSEEVSVYIKFDKGYRILDHVNYSSQMGYKDLEYFFHINVPDYNRFKHDIFLNFETKNNYTGFNHYRIIYDIQKDYSEWDKNRIVWFLSFILTIIITVPAVILNYLKLLK